VFTSKGKEIRLTDFKGKIIYKDVWATRCGPGIKKYRYLKTVKEI